MKRKSVLAAISPDLVVRNYSVEEAGDPTIFGRGGKILVGQEGCSHTFTLGLGWIKNPQKCVDELESLRQSLLADPYFKNVPSMKLEERKPRLPSMPRTTFRKCAAKCFG